MTEKGKDRVGTFSNRSSITSFKLSMREPVVQYTALYVGMTHYYISIVSSHLANLICLSPYFWTCCFYVCSSIGSVVKLVCPDRIAKTFSKSPSLCALLILTCCLQHSIAVVKDRAALFLIKDADRERHDNAIVLQYTTLTVSLSLLDYEGDVSFCRTTEARWYSG